MASVIENRTIRSYKRNLSSSSFAPPRLQRSSSEKALTDLVKKSYSSVRNRLQNASVKHLPPWDYLPEFDGRLVGPQRTSTAYVPNAFFTPVHAIEDAPVRLHGTYSPWAWPYAYQDSRVIRKDADIQGTRANERCYTNRTRNFTSSQSRSRRYYAGEIDHYLDDTERATDAYLRWSLGVESAHPPYYRAYWAPSGLLGRLGYYRPSLMKSYLRANYI